MQSVTLRVKIRAMSKAARRLCKYRTYSISDLLKFLRLLPACPPTLLLARLSPTFPISSCGHYSPVRFSELAAQVYAFNFSSPLVFMKLELLASRSRLIRGNQKG